MGNSLRFIASGDDLNALFEAEAKTSGLCRDNLEAPWPPDHPLVSISAP